MYPIKRQALNSVRVAAENFAAAKFTVTVCWMENSSAPLASIELLVPVLNRERTILVLKSSSDLIVLARRSRELFRWLWYTNYWINIAPLGEVSSISFSSYYVLRLITIRRNDV